MKKLRNLIEFDFLCDVVELSLTPALCRTESRGAHFRQDFPVADDTSWHGSIMSQRTSTDSISYRFQQVPDYLHENGESKTRALMRALQKQINRSMRVDSGQKDQRALYKRIYGPPPVGKCVPSRANCFETLRS